MIAGDERRGGEERRSVLVEEDMAYNRSANEVAHVLDMRTGGDFVRDIDNSLCSAGLSEVCDFDSSGIPAVSFRSTLVSPLFSNCFLC